MEESVRDPKRFAIYMLTKDIKIEKTDDKSLENKLELDREYEAGRRLANILAMKRVNDGGESRHSKTYSKNDIVKKLIDNNIVDSYLTGMACIRFLLSADWIGNSKLTEHKMRNLRDYVDDPVYILEERTVKFYRK